MGDARWRLERRYAPASGSTSYIQSQNASPQSSANFNIDGTGKAATLNATTAIQPNGTSINTAGTLSNVAYRNGTGHRSSLATTNLPAFPGAERQRFRHSLPDTGCRGTLNLFVAYTTSTLKIGIGTATPSYTLDVAGDINLSGSLRINGVVVCDSSGCTGGGGGGGGNVTNQTSLQSSANFNIQSAVSQFYNRRPARYRYRATYCNYRIQPARRYWVASPPAAHCTWAPTPTPA